MAKEEACQSFKSFDALAVAKALDSGSLSLTDHLDCSQSLLAEAVKQVGPRSVRVEVETPLGDRLGFGSGAFVGKDGTSVITNFHVVNNAPVTRIRTASGEVFNARIKDVDEVHDLAVLEVEGLKKDPGRSLEFGDESKLKPGDALFSVGHPAGSIEKVATEGSFREAAPYLLQFRPQVGREIINSAADFISKHPEFKKEAEARVMSHKLGTSTPLWKGNSGGPVVDNTFKLMGLATAMDTIHGESNVVTPGSLAKDLMNRPVRQFEFKYERPSEFQKDPVSTGVATGLVLGAAYAFRRVAVPALGTFDALSAYENFSTAARDDLYAPRSTYLKEGALDTIGAIGGAMSLFARSRGIGVVLVGGRLLARAATQFMPGDPVMTGVTRTNGDSRPPLGFDF